MGEDLSSEPRNAGILAYLGRSQPGAPPEARLPGEVKDPYYTLGTHPDLVAHLWDVLAKPLPEDCRRVVFRAPVLLHPRTCVIFAFAGGTHTYGFRLPERERAEALAAGAPRRMVYPGGAVLDLERFGPEWVLGRWFRAEESWCRAAYDLAGEPPPRPEP